MTAVVGILNKNAVAIAADSAVTIGGNGGRKIFNKANKVFTLSKQHPVGIMLYNSASFMGTPWETIIKVYRKELGDRAFNTLREYQENFIQFLHTKNFYTDANVQINFLEGIALNIINSLVNEIAQNHPNLINNPTPENQALFLTLFEEKIDAFYQGWRGSNTEVCIEFIDYTFEAFEVYSHVVFNKINQESFLNNGFTITPELLVKIKMSVYAVIKVREYSSNYTGLIFTGFGENEIYPQLIPAIISMAIDNRLRYFIDEAGVASISNSNNGAVRPFAQTDVIDTILSGIDPSLDAIYLNNFNSLFKKYNQAIVGSIGESNPLLKEQIEKLNTDAIVHEFNMLNQQIKRENYINPLMNAVSTLAKEDLAEMAESLIYLTYLKRRITFAEESVGGPVDVAVISKGDGFVWIKRKHYFAPGLNQHFFDNYFKK